MMTPRAAVTRDVGDFVWERGWRGRFEAALSRAPSARAASAAIPEFVQTPEARAPPRPHRHVSSGRSPPRPEARARTAARPGAARTRVLQPRGPWRPHSAVGVKIRAPGKAGPSLGDAARQGPAARAEDEGGRAVPALAQRGRHAGHAAGLSAEDPGARAGRLRRRRRGAVPAHARRPGPRGARAARGGRLQPQAWVARPRDSQVGGAERSKFLFLPLTPARGRVTRDADARGRCRKRQGVATADVSAGACGVPPDRAPQKRQLYLLKM